MRVPPNASRRLVRIPPLLDCGEQLQKSLELISKEGGVLIYLRQEGRGIGIIQTEAKHAILQDQGINITVDANTHLGFEADEQCRTETAIVILKDLGIKNPPLDQ
ncbi:MAG: hypothetical protein R2806_23700 [Saprospiraceae bacterium]